MDSRLYRRRFLELAMTSGPIWMSACSSSEGLRVLAFDAGPPDAHPNPAVDAAGSDAGSGHPDDDPRLPSLGGAPDTLQGHIVAAFVDTVIPGRHRDPEGIAGGLDVGACALFFDPLFPAQEYVGALALLLESGAKTAHDGLGFVALTPRQREALLDGLIEPGAPLEFAVTLAKLAYLSTPEAGKAFGYPGANLGYVNHPDLSFGRAMSRELTVDGNLG